MKLSHWFVGLVLLALIMGCSQQSGYKQNEDGIVLSLVQKRSTDPRMVNIQVCSENIIRVVASQKKKVSTRPGLMVKKTDWEPVKWKLEETE